MISIRKYLYSGIGGGRDPEASDSSDGADKLLHDVLDAIGQFVLAGDACMDAVEKSLRRVCVRDVMFPYARNRSMRSADFYRSRSPALTVDDAALLTAVSESISPMSG